MYTRTRQTVDMYVCINACCRADSKLVFIRERVIARRDDRNVKRSEDDTEWHTVYIRQIEKAMRLVVRRLS